MKVSFIITVYTNEGIIMASDSRTTYNLTTTYPNGNVETRIGVHITDTTFKTFLCKNNIGISTCGDASIAGIPITGYIEEFIAQQTNSESTVEAVSDGLNNFFSQFSPRPNTIFFVSGYSHDLHQKIFVVKIATGEIIPVNTSSPGVIWDGESDVFLRLTKAVIINNENGTYTDLPKYSTSFNFFTLQDAINYAEYAVDVTIKTMSFQDRGKTVGGPIDILAIKPTEAFWVKRKELHA